VKNLAAIITALILSPLTAGLGFGLAFYIRSPNDFKNLMQAEGLFHLIGPDIYVSGMAYALTIVFGLPGYFFLRWLKLDVSYVIVAWALIVGLGFTYFARFGSKEWQWEFGVFPALIVSLTAVLILNAYKIVPKKI
jgi:hypothetical protein